jgi:hypothetical protein
MDLKQISNEIRYVISQRQQQIQLSFIEENHIYYMLDKNGVLRNDFVSVSKLVKKFHPYFDAPAKALEKSNGDVIAQKKLLEEWSNAGKTSTNLGSRTHFLLEEYLVGEYGNYKEVRQPIFNVTPEQIIKGDKMVQAGKDYIKLMHERGAVLLDTEIVMGDPELGYTGQKDMGWLMMNKEQTDFGLVVSDWKTNQPKNFEVQPYTRRLYPPFEKYHDTSLGHYYVQLPLYARLLLKMLKGSKYENLKLLGCVVVLLKEDGSFVEYKVPPEINNKVLTLDLSKYIK